MRDRGTGRMKQGEEGRGYGCCFVLVYIGLCQLFDAADGLGDAVDLVAYQCESLRGFAQVDLLGMGLGVANHLHEVGGLVEWVVWVGDEVADEPVLLEDEFFDAEVFGHASEGDGFDEFFGGAGDGAETVDEA